MPGQMEVESSEIGVDRVGEGDYSAGVGGDGAETTEGACWRIRTVKDRIIMKSLGITALVMLGAWTTYGEGTYPTDGTVSTNEVNLREAPKTSAAFLLTLYKGDKLRVLGQEADWYKVELPGDRSLWVNNKYVQRGTGETGVISGTSVNVRDGAGMEFKRVGMVQTGRKVKVLGEQGEWVNISYLASDHGYINIRYVTLAGQTKPTMPTEPPKPPVAGEEQTGVLVTFKKAEELFETEMNKAAVETWKMDEVEKLYKEVAEKATDETIKGTAKDRLAFITFVKQAQATMVNPEEYRKKLAEVEARIDAKFRKKREEILARKPSPTYLATGRIEKLASGWLKPANYKLMDGNKLVYLLYSDKEKLENYEGRYVGIIGDVDRSLKYDIPTVKVQSVDILERKETGTGGGAEDK